MRQGTRDQEHEGPRKQRTGTVAIIAAMKAGQLLVVSLVLCAGFAEARTVVAQANSPSAPAPSAVATVPFVGCASDGQGGPQKAPNGKSLAVAIPAPLAERLAYYKAKYGIGVLAPRGWHCFSTYGSSGENLFVSPDPIESQTLLSLKWQGFTGPAVQATVYDGGTSGRFEVAKVIARIFPAYKTFAQKVIAEGSEPASDFPFGPYADDKLTNRANNIVEFETPGSAQGLGTDSRLQMNASPIDGVAIIGGKDTDLTMLTARFSGSDQDLIAAMVAQAESEAAVGRYM
jgi:hypothetical protein